jgi:hypothetical protein
VRRLTPHAAWLAACGTLCALLAGCAHNKPKAGPVVASRYYGTWMQVRAEGRNWWELSATDVASYRNPDCSRLPVAAVLGPDRVQATDGSVMDLRVAEGHLLLFVSDDMEKVAAYVRVDANATCRVSDGNHTEGGTPPARTPVLASRYYGVWANVRDHQRSWWWEVGAGGVTTYGYDADRTCTSVHIPSLGPDRIGVQFGNTRAASLHLAEHNLLLGLSEDGTGYALYARSDARAICRNADGTYAKNAPHAVSKR